MNVVGEWNILTRRAPQNCNFTNEYTEQNQTLKKQEPKLYMRSLPPALFLNGYVKGLSELNYELYLSELLCQSFWFKKHIGTNDFRYCTNQSRGQADCYAEKYGIDFKLFSSYSNCQARRHFSERIEKTPEGAVFKKAKPQEAGMEASILLALFKDYSFNEIKRIAETEYTDNRADNLEERGAASAIKTLKVQKNLLFLMTDFFLYDGEFDKGAGIEEITQLLTKCLSAYMNFRLETANGFDTFFSFIFGVDLILLKWELKEFKYLEAIPLNASKTFMELERYNFPPFYFTLEKINERYL